MNELVQFLTYAAKVFGLPRLLRGVRDDRSYPQIPTRPVLLSLLFGVVLRVGSYLDLAGQTRKRRWRRLIHWKEPISHDTLEYVAERLDLEDLRAALVAVNKQLKTQKALESSKINGLLFLSPAPAGPTSIFTAAAGVARTAVKGSWRKRTPPGSSAPLSSITIATFLRRSTAPNSNVLLDLEPIRPGEGEADAALSRTRDSGASAASTARAFSTPSRWMPGYVQGPFLQAVEKLGWGCPAPAGSSRNGWRFSRKRARSARGPGPAPFSRMQAVSATSSCGRLKT